MLEKSVACSNFVSSFYIERMPKLNEFFKKKQQHSQVVVFFDVIFMLIGIIPTCGISLV